MSGKLHELLAAEEDLKGMAKRITAETENTFTKKSNHFMEQLIEIAPLKETDGPTVVDGHTPMVETVSGKIGYFSNAVGSYLDAFYQKEQSNTQAKADVVLEDSTVLLKDIPATALLGLERELKKIHQVYSSLPTLDPSMVWKDDSDTGAGIRITHSTKVRTKKIIKPFVLAEATDRHPAQVEKVSEDIAVANMNTTLRSSKITPARKSILLSRVDELSRAVKKARMRANSVEHATGKIGNKIFTFLNA
jgi:hypothetical protein